jgi:Domain of unknown function (DUF397)
VSTIESTEPAWRRTRRCESANCVEIAIDGDGGDVLMRSSLDSSQMLRLGRDQWTIFVEMVKNDELRPNPSQS